MRGFDGVEPDFDCPRSKPWLNAPEPEPRPAPSRVRQVGNFAKAAARATMSRAKTKLLRSDRATPEQKAARLAVCEACPGGHAVRDARGDLWTCGPMVASMTGRVTTCGCILRAKAEDRKQLCPFGFWPTIEGQEVEDGGEENDGG